jgi:hypothetical protein
MSSRFGCTTTNTPWPRKLDPLNLVFHHFSRGGGLEVMHPGGGLEVWMLHVRISSALQAVFLDIRSDKLGSCRGVMKFPFLYNFFQLLKPGNKAP